MEALRHLLGGYFHQDWDLDGGEVSDTIDAFARKSPIQVEAALVDIDTLLSMPLPAGGLEALLDEMGCDYYAGDTDDDYRAWLGELRGLLTRHLPG